MIFLAILLCATAKTESANQPTKTIIRLPEEYVVQKNAMQSIRLGDIAGAIQAPSQEDLLQLVGIELIGKPDPGQVVKLSRTQIHLAIREAKYDFANVIFEGANVINVYGTGKKVTIPEMVEAIRNKIKQETGWSNEELVFRVLTAPSKDAWLPDKEFETVVERINPLLYGNSRYEVSFFVDHILVDKAIFNVKVARMRKIYKPIRDMRRGEVIAAGDLREEWMEIDTVFNDRQIAESPQELIGNRCKLDLRKSEPIRLNGLETNYVLRRGDIVQMVVRSNGMVLQTTAQAQSRGAPGETIPVKTIGSGKVVFVKVINSGWVELVS
jgi:flagella basal body P-ring formation protein FlgA